MNTAAMMNNTLDNTIHRDKAGDFPDPIICFGQPLDERQDARASGNQRRNGLYQFISELRRRRVCRAATMYAISMWLICQVLEIMAPALELPDWTLKIVIVFGLLGFPIALILSWLLEFTPDGLVVDGATGSRADAAVDSTPRRPIDQTLDCGLVLAALFIAGHLAIGMLTTETIVGETASQEISVIPFRVASANEADVLSEGLLIELQHELATRTDMKVVAPRDSYLRTDGVSVTGAVAVGQDLVRVTVTMFDNKTQVVSWSQVFEQPRSDMPLAASQFAREIVAALPRHLVVTEAQRDGHAT